MGRPIRIVVAKLGLDGHDRGAKVVARALRDAGCEVVYSGLHQTPAQIARIAVDEDADAIGVSTMSGAHLTLLPRLIAELAELEAAEIKVFAGGIIPPADHAALRAAGVAAIFTPGTPLAEIADWVGRELG